MWQVSYTWVWPGPVAIDKLIWKMLKVGWCWSIRGRRRIRGDRSRKLGWVVLELTAEESDCKRNNGWLNICLA